MNGSFDFSTCRWAPGLAVQIGRATKLHHIPSAIFDNLITLEDVGILQPHLAPGTKPEVFRRRIFHKIVALDVELARERQLATASRGVLWIINSVQFLGFALR